MNAIEAAVRCRLRVAGPSIMGMLGQRQCLSSAIPKATLSAAGRQFQVRWSVSNGISYQPGVFSSGCQVARFSSKRAGWEASDNNSSKDNNSSNEQKDKSSNTRVKNAQFKLKANADKAKKLLYEKSRALPEKIIPEPIKKIIPEHENIYTVPNMLTATRLVAAPLIGYFIVHHQISVALPLFIYLCVTDFIDGYLARRYNLKTIVGSIIDPMADKLLMVSTTLALAASNYDFPLYLAAVILGKDILMGLAAVVVRYQSLPPPKTARRYWDFSVPSVKVSPTTISKYNTAFQMVYITIAIFKPVVAPLLGADTLALFDAAFEYYGYFVAATTVLAGGSYLWSKDAVKYIK